MTPTLRFYVKMHTTNVGTTFVIRWNVWDDKGKGRTVLQARSRELAERACEALNAIDLDNE